MLGGVAVRLVVPGQGATDVARRRGTPSTHPSADAVPEFPHQAEGKTRTYRLPAQGVIATLRRVCLMVTSNPGFVEAGR